MKKIAIIVAGGKGKRMNAGIPKQFILLAGLPVLMHCIRCFHESDPGIGLIVVLPENEINAWEGLCNKYSFDIIHKVVAGGETRFHSVKNGLTQVNEKSLVAVHDGARPFPGAALIKNCFSRAEEFGTAVPAIPVNESLRRVEGEENQFADRSSYVLIQTPQCFKSEILLSAYNTNYNKNFTDDASIVEFSGHSIHLIEGERENIKITYPVDIAIGEAILKSRVK